MKFNSFEELPCWKLSLRVIKLVYDLTSKKEFSRDYFLKDQIRRSCISVSSNIVEGFERTNNNEFIRFLKIAKGSSGEARSQLYIARELNYINQDEFIKVKENLYNLPSQMGGFLNYLKLRKSEKQFKAKK